MRKSSVFLILSVLCFVCAGIFFGLNLREDMQAGQSSDQITAAVLSKIEHSVVANAPASSALSQQITAGDLDTACDQSTPNRTSEGIRIDDTVYCGSLYVSAWDKSFAVCDTCTLANLKKSPCRYIGSAEENNLVVAAHNYKTHFGRLADLPIGSTITFTDACGVLYTYEVTNITVVDAYDSASVAGWKGGLSLFTCTLGGQSRVLAQCSLVHS